MLHEPGVNAPEADVGAGAVAAGEDPDELEGVWPEEVRLDVGVQATNERTAEATMIVKAPCLR